MVSTDRPEFEKHLAVLCAGLDTPCTAERKEAYWIGLQKMALSVFARTVTYILEEEDWTRMPKPRQVWTSSGRMRATAMPTGPRDDGYRGDVWDIAANNYLRGHIHKVMQRDPQAYGRPASVQALQADEETLRVLGLDARNLDASPEFVHQMHRLVEAKALWAADMRDLQVNGEVPVRTQIAVWRDYIGRAEQPLSSSEAA